MGPDQHVLGADDGIRTRDPNLGNVECAVQAVPEHAATWTSVQPVVRRVARIPACLRTLYFEFATSHSP